MSNFLRDETALPFPKVDAPALGPFDSTNTLFAADWNAACQALTDMLGAVASVDTVANLKSTILPTAARACHVSGYASAGDGGGGLFVWMAGDATADDGGTVLASTYPSAPAGRWRRVRSPGWLDVRWFGATDNTGATDMSVQIQKALDAANAAGGGVVYVPTGKWAISNTNSNAVFGDTLGGCKVWSNTTVRGDGPKTRFVRTGSGTNYTFRAVNASGIRYEDFCVDMAVDQNFRVAVYALKSSDIKIRRCMFVTSTVPGANWTNMACHSDTAHDYEVSHCTAVRTQFKFLGSKIHHHHNISINPSNEGVSCVIQGNGADLVGFYCHDNYIEGAADCGIFYGQDDGANSGTSTFRDAHVCDNQVLGFTSRGILMRQGGSTNQNWNVSNNVIRGSNFASSTVATVTSSTGTLTTGQGAQYPTSGWGYLELGKEVMELVQFTRSGDVLTFSRNTTFSHSNGCEFWALTLAMVSGSFGIDVRQSSDNGGGGIKGLNLNDNSVENVDQQAFSVTSGTALSDWTVCNNRTHTGRGIYVGAATSTQTIKPGAISGNVLEGYSIYGINVQSASTSNVTHGPVVISGNVVNGDGTSNSISGIRAEVGTTATLKIHAFGNVLTGMAGFSATGGIVEVSGGGTIDGSYNNNDLRGNSTAAVFLGNSTAHGNRGWVTENKGQATITTGNTSVVVTHGLSVTPTLQDISITLSNQSTVDPQEIYVDTIGSTQFTVHCRTNPSTSGLTFGWRAVVL